MTTTDIKIVSTRKPLNVSLVGVDYNITPPKAALAIEMARDIKGAKTKKPEEVMDTLYEWLSMCMDEEGVAAIRARLMNPTDDLDIPHITELLTAVMERITENPPTSPSGS
jgi:hypothetical protein